MLKKIPIFLATILISFNLQAFDDIDSMSPQMVISPSKMPQAVSDSPSSVTIIEGDTIRDLGITNIAEIFRLVPGFHVGNWSPLMTANRGENVNIPRRLEVMVDGSPQSYGMYSRTDFHMMPVTIESIDHVEIVRSQSTATHGANAFYGAINFVTKNPNSTSGTYVNVSGSDVEKDVTIGSYFGLGEATNVRMEAQGRKLSGFETYYSQPERERNDDLKLGKFNVRATSQVSDTLNLDVTANYVDLTRDLETQGLPYDVTYPVSDEHKYQGFVKLTKNFDNHDLSVKFNSNYVKSVQDWTVALPKYFYQPDLVAFYEYDLTLAREIFEQGDTSNATIPELMQAGAIQTAIMTDPTSNDLIIGDVDISYVFRRWDFEIEDVAQLTDSTRLQTGYAFRKWTINGRVYAGKTTLYKNNFQANLEQKVDSWLTINAGFMLESIDKNFSDPRFSPRLGLNFHLNPQHTIRLVASDGKRTEDGLLLIEDIVYKTTVNQDVYGQTGRLLPVIGFVDETPDDAQENIEENRSYEISYYANLHNNLTWDIKVYQENITDAITDTVTDILKNDIKREGIESEVRYHYQNFETAIAGHYIDSESTEVNNDFNAYGGSLYGIYRFDSNWRLSSGVYTTSPTFGKRYNRFDLGAGKQFELPSKQALELAITYRLHDKHYIRGVDYANTSDDGTREHRHELMAQIKLDF